jgi:hypothetical protein
VCVSVAFNLVDHEKRSHTTEFGGEMLLRSKQFSCRELLSERSARSTFVVNDQNLKPLLT